MFADMAKRQDGPRAAALYLRISEDKRDDELGIGRQEKDCHGLAERKGWPVADVYIDNDVSAASGERRPSYERLLEDIESGVIDAVITWELDRLHRRPIELEQFFEVCDRAGVRHLASVGGDVDLSTGDGLLVARVKGAVAAEEITKLRKRVRRKKLELADRGLPAGGRRPFGFAPDAMTHVEEEAEAIRHAARRVLLGVQPGTIVNEWNRRGPATVSGTIWRTNALKRILISPRIVGLRQHQGQVHGVAAWQPILDRGTWEQVCAVLTDPGRRTSDDARSYLLSGGLSRCGHPECGGRLVGRPQRANRPAYNCVPSRGGCGHMSILAEPTEALVIEAVLLRADSPGLARALHGDERSDHGELNEVIRSADEKLSELASMWAADEITRAEWVTARQRIEARIDHARKQLAKRSRKDALLTFAGTPGALRASWTDMDFSQRRAVLTAIIDRIVIGPALHGRNRFDPGRIDVRWRA